MEFMDYVKPELFVVAVVLYFLGVAVKKSKILDCRFIPLLNGICGTKWKDYSGRNCE